ncbi:hypothetical protein AB0C91_09065 [Streptomyces sp. NPDC048674]|uniref:GP88 family protein n=1 Tax=Streptomyces sp. NPDC048674 TaxID=3155491 RepID=UPI00343E2420
MLIRLHLPTALAAKPIRLLSARSSLHSGSFAPCATTWFGQVNPACHQTLGWNLLFRSNGWQSQGSSDLLAVLGPAPVVIPSNNTPTFGWRMNSRTVPGLAGRGLDEATLVDPRRCVARPRPQQVRVGIAPCCFVSPKVDQSRCGIGEPRHLRLYRGWGAEARMGALPAGTNLPATRTT